MTALGSPGPHSSAYNFLFHQPECLVLILIIQEGALAIISTSQCWMGTREKKRPLCPLGTSLNFWVSLTLARTEWLQIAFQWDWEMQSIFSMAMCSTRNWWSYYCRKRGKQTLESTDIFATCTHTKGKTQCPDGILQNNKLEESALGRLSSFVFISSLAQTCLPLPFPVFVCEA